MPNNETVMSGISLLFVGMCQEACGKKAGGTVETRGEKAGGMVKITREEGGWDGGNTRGKCGWDGQWKHEGRRRVAGWWGEGKMAWTQLIVDW